jgi:hypothetical protein
MSENIFTVIAEGIFDSREDTIEWEIEHAYDYDEHEIPEGDEE